MNTGWAKNCTFSIRYIDGTVQDKMVFTKMFREHKRPNTRWKARVKFLLSVIELLSFMQYHLYIKFPPS